MNNYLNGYQSSGAQSTQNSLTDIYQELNRIRNTTPYNQYRTVFNDIADE
jgi:hypothetical protein